MKKLFLAALSTMACACSIALAGTPAAVNNATGTAVYGTEQALSIEKEAVTNRVKVRYSSGIQYVADDAAWSRYAALKAGMSKPVDAPASSTGLSYDIAKVNGISCMSGSSTVTWPNVGQPDTIADSCAFFTAAKAAAN